MLRDTHDTPVHTGIVCAQRTRRPTCAGNNDVSGPDGVLTRRPQGQKQLWVGDGDSRVWVLNPTTGAS